jgi:poly-D-alanine transfer protein DltD
MRFAEHRMCLAGRHHAAVDHDHLSIAGWMYYDEVLDAFSRPAEAPRRQGAVAVHRWVKEYQ